MNNITRTFSTWEEFLDYVEELNDFLYDNDYIYRGREKIMQNETTFIADLKEKGLYEKYLDFQVNCKKYLDENIVVYNSWKDKRYKEFDYSFRFLYQPWAEKYEEYSHSYEKNSVFVWDLINYRSTPWFECAYSVVHPIVFELPVNEKYYELGCCWFSKNVYSIENVETNQICEYTTEDNLKKFIQVICTMFPTQEGLPKLACVGVETRRDNSNIPGPKSSWDVMIGGFKLEKTPNEDSFKVTIGLKSKTNIMVSTWHDSIEFKNQETQMATKELFVKVVDAIKLYLNIDEGQVKTITWYNKKGKPHIINSDGDICIYCYNVALDKEFQSLKGEFTASNPYDPIYWGWT